MSLSFSSSAVRALFSETSSSRMFLPTIFSSSSSSFTVASASSALSTARSRFTSVIASLRELSSYFLSESSAIIWASARASSNFSTFSSLFMFKLSKTLRALSASSAACADSSYFSVTSFSFSSVRSKSSSTNWILRWSARTSDSAVSLSALSSSSFLFKLSTSSLILSNSNCISVIFFLTSATMPSLDETFFPILDYFVFQLEEEEEKIGSFRFLAEAIRLCWPWPLWICWTWSLRICWSWTSWILCLLRQAFSMNINNLSCSFKHLNPVTNNIFQCFSVRLYRDSRESREFVLLF